MCNFHPVIKNNTQTKKFGEGGTLKGRASEATRVSGYLQSLVVPHEVGASCVKRGTSVGLKESYRKSLEVQMQRNSSLFRRLQIMGTRI